MRTGDDAPEGAVAEALRAGAERLDVHEQAAVGLLIEHRYWLGRFDFTDECTRSAPGGAEIMWNAARDFADREDAAAPACRLVLDAAVMIGSGGLHPGVLGHGDRKMLAVAFVRALDVEGTVQMA